MYEFRPFILLILNLFSVPGGFKGAGQADFPGGAGGPCLQHPLRPGRPLQVGSLLLLLLLLWLLLLLYTCCCCC